MKLTLVQRRLAAFFLAYIGVIYELGYAQLLSATLGNTYFRYATTIGIFTLTLGIASLLQERR
ncbi:hypothetical protein C1X78_25870, partial [Pseudomonas sp. MPR-R1B]|uniref:hypothetical protein n=1 Tax=Pseudomonas sp. MPR-R1B TaxID=2070678 RepID=UPI000CBB04D8